jgi:hypothetical protein
MKEGENDAVPHHDQIPDLELAPQGQTEAPVVFQTPEVAGQ